MPVKKKEPVPDSPPVQKDPELPEYTEIGDNSMSFIFNHQLVIADGPDIFLGGIRVLYGSQSGDLSFSGGVVSDTLTKDLYFELKNILSCRTYLLDSTNNVSFNHAEGDIHDKNRYDYFYNTTNVYTGELTITKLDTANKIIAGKFHFKAKKHCYNNKDTCTEVIEIPKGQFDIWYGY